MGTVGTNLVSANFCYQNQIKPQTLKDLVILKMAVQGSRSQIHHEAIITLQLGKRYENHTFRVAALDKWDIILGMPFLQKHHAIINLGKHSIFLPILGIYLRRQPNY